MLFLKWVAGQKPLRELFTRNSVTANFFNKPISEIPLPENCVVAAVTRNSETFMGSDKLLLCPGDRLIIFILGKTDKTKIQNLFMED